MPKLAACTLVCANQNELDGLVQFLDHGQLICTVEYTISALQITILPWEGSTESDLAELLQYLMPI